MKNWWKFLNDFGINILASFEGQFGAIITASGSFERIDIFTINFCQKKISEIQKKSVDLYILEYDDALDTEFSENFWENLVDDFLVKFMWKSKENLLVNLYKTFSNYFLRHSCELPLNNKKK